MKQSIVQQVVKGSFLIALIGLVSATNIVAQDIQQLPLGSTLPLGDVQMEDISGRNLSLNEVKGDNGLLVIFHVIPALGLLNGRIGILWCKNLPR